jgi:hypothetical protein
MLRLLQAIFGFIRAAFYGTLLTLVVSVLLAALLFHLLDEDSAWAVKWVITAFDPFAAALVFFGTCGLIALCLKTGVCNLR